MENVKFLNGDLPSKEAITFGFVNVDTEFMGLNLTRDRLCLVQIYDPRNRFTWVLRIPANPEKTAYPNLIEFLYSNRYHKIFHYAMADVIQLSKTFGTFVRNVYCTRTLSRIGRTYASSHGLASVLKEQLKINLSKELATSYWGGELTAKQVLYAIKDVLFLHLLLACLLRIVLKEKREGVFYRMNRIIAMTARNFVENFSTEDLLSHH